MLQKTTFLYLLSFISIMQISYAQITAIPDSDFEQRLIDLGLDDVIDGQVLTANINTVTSFTINSSGYNPSNLSGIEDFSALETLIVTGRPALTTLDLSNNINLINVDLSGNFNLNPVLNLSNSPNLNNLDISGAISISTLDVSSTNLSTLDVSNTNLSTLDLSSNTNLSTLDVSYTNLSTLDLSSNTNLSTLDVSNTNLSTLDLSSNTNLSTLDVSYTNLSTLDVSNTNLSTLDLSGLSYFSNLNITNTNLSDLRVNGTAITTLDVSLHTNLTTLFVSENSNLTELNVQNGTNTNITQFISILTPNLSCIQVDDVAYSNANWINRDSANSFNTDCGFTLGVNDNEFNADFSIYPNPVSDVLNVSASTTVNSLGLYDLKGKLITTSKNTFIDTSLLTNGIYILKIETEKGIENRKIIKK